MTSADLVQLMRRPDDYLESGTPGIKRLGIGEEVGNHYLPERYPDSQTAYPRVPPTTVHPSCFKFRDAQYSEQS